MTSITLQSLRSRDAFSERASYQLTLYLSCCRKSQIQAPDVFEKTGCCQRLSVHLLQMDRRSDGYKEIYYYVRLFL
jgi:hypothetical protein